MRERIVGRGVWCIALALALPRVLERHFHVDELQIAYEAALLGVHDLPAYVTGTTPLLIVLGAMMKAVDTAVAMLAIGRLLFFVLFAAKLAAIAWAQPYWPSTRGRLAVLAAATLFFPVWLNGFEIRMDLVTSLGSVILYGLAQRARTASARSFALAGACAATMQAHSFKALLYWVPFTLVLVVLAKEQRVRRAGAIALGFVGGLLVNLLPIVVAGRAGVYARMLGNVGGYIEAANRFSPVPELLRLVAMSPLAFALALALPYFAAKRREPRSLVTLAFLGWSLVALFVNPLPYAYNFIHLLPFVLFAALDTAARLPLRAALAAGVVTISLFVYGWLTEPYLRRSNHAQASYMRAVEALTAPTDPVLDPAGLVVSRRPPDPDWFVHSLRMAAYRDGRLKRYAEIMQEHPSPVAVDNYRWGWLSREDLAVRAAMYVPIAPRLFVLGQRFAAPEGDFDVFYPGNYDIVGATVDGKTDGALTVGTHHYVRTGDRAGIRWAGPRRAAVTVETLGRGEPMFTNEPREVVMAQQ